MRYLAIVIVALVFVAPAAAAPPPAQVSLEVVGQQQLGAAMAFQQWNQALSAGGVKNFRLRSSDAGDRPAIESVGTDDAPAYKVTGVISGADELIVPGAKFRRTECKRLAGWLDDLSKRGQGQKQEKVAAFGLTSGQLDKVNDDLKKTVGFATKGMARKEAVDKIAGQLGLALKIDGELAEGDDKIEEELAELSCGTALACILRPIGYRMLPRAAGDTLSYAVAKAKLEEEVWPIGWPAENVPKTLPGIYEMHNVNVENVPADKLLAVVGRQLKTPVLYDHNALARHGIEPDKVLVSHPQQRTSYNVALRRMMPKAKLKVEVRVDEAGKPFLWVSTLKPV